MTTSNKEPLTPAKLNELHAQFWLRQSALTERRASDPAVVQFALWDMQFDNAS
jgi:hypothetical protein